MLAVTHLHQAHTGRRRQERGHGPALGTRVRAQLCRAHPGPLKGQGQGSKLTLEAHLQPR